MGHSVVCLMVSYIIC